jgi:hypothetical protein
MGIEVRVCLIDLKHAFRRLIARLPDESEAGADFIVFRAVADHLEIVSGGTSETLSATVVHLGKAGVPCPVFSWHRSNYPLLSSKDRFRCFFEGPSQNRSH